MNQILPELARPHRRKQRRATKTFIFLIGLYLLVVLLLFSIQKKLIFPGHERQGRADSVIAELPAGVELVSLASSGTPRLMAIFGSALDDDGRELADAASRPTIVYFYGNAMCMRDTLEAEFAEFRRMGVNVLVPDYYGFGMSSGTPSEANCYTTADSAYAYLTRRKDIDATKIIAAGWSLGGAVAIDLAARRQVVGLIVFSSFTSMTEMAKKNFPFVPAKLLLRHRFESESKIENVRCPILIGHGTDDPLIPVAMAERLAAAAKRKRSATVERGQDVSVIKIEAAGHNDFYTIGGNQLDREIRGFLERVR